MVIVVVVVVVMVQTVKMYSVMNLSPQSWTKERTLYRIYTKELNRELFTGLSTLYTKGPWSMVHAKSLQPTLNCYMCTSRPTYVVHIV